MSLLKHIFTSQYLFQINYAFISPREKLFLFSGGILVLLAVALKIAAVMAPNPVDERIRQKFYLLFLSIGISQLLWYGCRAEDVNFFGSHFVAWLILLVGAAWFVILAISAAKNYGKDKDLWNKEQLKLKYLPK